MVRWTVEWVTETYLEEDLLLQLMAFQMICQDAKVEEAIAKVILAMIMTCSDLKELHACGGLALVKTALHSSEEVVQNCALLSVSVLLRRWPDSRVFLISFISRKVLEDVCHYLQYRDPLCTMSLSSVS